jgi:hypothetical protein
MKYTLCFFAIAALFLSSCKDKLIIGSDQSKSFEKFYGNIYQNNGNDVKVIPESVQFPNGGYAVTGYTYNDSLGLKTDKDMLFIILDKYGNLVGKPKQFGGKKDDEAYRVDVIPGGNGFILTGYTTIGTQRHAYIVRLNPAGTDTVWTFKSSVPESVTEEAYSLHVDIVSNKYTVVGYQTQSGQQVGWIFDLDDHGVYSNSLTANIGQYKGHDNPNVIFSDIGYINAQSMGIFGSYSTPASPGVSAFSQAIIFATSNLGNYNVGNANALVVYSVSKNEFPQQILIMPDGKGAYLSSYDSINESTSCIHLLIYNNPEAPANPVISANWYYFDPASGSLEAAKMKYIESENAFVVLANLTPANSTSNTSIVLIKIDASSGAEIWRHNYGINANYNASGIDIASDGGFIITGYNNSTGYNQSVLVIKTTADGLLQ